MIHAIIIDDERGNRENLQSMLQEYCPQVRVVASAPSAKEGRAAINSFKPELVFLDIEMPVMNGFMMLEEMGEIDFEVIFVTAFDKYAIRAIKLGALDYLLKPFTGEDLMISVKRAEVKIQSGISGKNKMEILFSNLKMKGKSPVRIAIPDHEGLQFIEIKRILRI